MSGLGRIFTRERDPRSRVAWRWDAAAGRDRPVPWQEFREQVARLAARLERAPAGAWLVEVSDTYACGVALLALWASGRSAILPPNLQPGSLARLETRSAGVLSDRPERRSAAGAIDPLDVAAAPAALGELPREALALELFTSGSTGDEKRLTKHIRHLADEVDLLEEIWGPRLGSCTVFSTASHHHLYGLLFGLLWPLAAGRPFHPQHFLRPSELLPRIRAVADCALAGVPAQLRRLARHRDAGELAGRCRAIFSSGGLLARDTSLLLAARTHTTPIEVFGSTETGGVAWRCQVAGTDPTPWQPLPHVHVDRDPARGAARVRSPFVSTGDPEHGFAMGDRIELLPDGRFVLGARTDRTVKVGEKRLDLALMESDLRGHELVADAALTVLERAGEPRVAAVLVLTPAGERLLRADGRRGLTRRLGEHLAQSWDAVLMPRAWRNVASLPEDRRGKTTAEALRALFETPAGAASPGARTEDRPVVLSRERDGAALVWRCRVPEELSCWPGHFPDLLVVPGVLQIDWAMDAASELLGELPRIDELSQVTFRETLRPGDAFQLCVEATPDGWLRFRLWGDESEYAAGRARVLRAAEADA